MLPQMLAYSNMIIQAQLQFSGDGWLTYDRMFRIAAASSRNTNCRNVDASLYARFVSCQPRRGGVCQLCCSTAHRGLTPAHGGWMNQPHPNILQQYRPPGTLGRCSLGLQAHHPSSSGLQFAPHGIRATVASEGAATTATFVPFASSRVTVTKSAPHLPQVPGARLGGPCIPVYRSQAGPMQPPSRIP